MSLPGSFRLTGPRGDGSAFTDPRTTAVRPDLAELALAGAFVRPHYAAPVLREIIAVRTPLQAAPDGASEMLSEALLGEPFAVLDVAGGWAWGYGTLDRHVGYVAATAIGQPAAGDHRLVGPADGLVFRAPSIKSPVEAWLPAGSELALAPGPAPFRTIASGPFAGLFVHRRHLVDAATGADWVTVAESFNGTPYRWGGRTRTGVDCSGLIQIALKLSGRAARRDSDMLFADAGPEIDATAATRGNLVWWPGHIGVLVAADRLLHANAHWMTTVVEPLAEVVARVAAAGGPPPRFRRGPV